MADQAQAAAHWDDAYAQGEDTRSWFEQHPDMSLRKSTRPGTGVSTVDALIDAGRRRMPPHQGAAGSRLPRPHGPGHLRDRVAARPRPPRLASRPGSLAGRRGAHLAAPASLPGLAWPGGLPFPDHRSAPAAVPAHPGHGHRAGRHRRLRLFRTGRAAALLRPASGPLQPGRASPPARRQVELDEPGPGRAHHPGRHHPAVHLDRAAKRIPSPGSRSRRQSGFSAISQNPSAGSTCASINACSAASRSGRPSIRARYGRLTSTSGTANSARSASLIVIPRCRPLCSRRQPASELSAPEGSRGTSQAAARSS